LKTRPTGPRAEAGQQARRDAGALDQGGDSGSGRKGQRQELRQLAGHACGVSAGRKVYAQSFGLSTQQDRVAVPGAGESCGWNSFGRKIRSSVWKCSI